MHSVCILLGQLLNNFPLGYFTETGTIFTLINVGNMNIYYQ